MALNLNQWVNYAKTKLDAVVGRQNAELDRLEAEQAADVADKPWLSSSTEAPTLDEARARIEWETQRQADLAARDQGADAPPAAAAPSPQDADATAEAAQAKVELDERQKAATERLEQIRQELGVEAPPNPEG